jgi:hypothetical protein
VRIGNLTFILIFLGVNQISNKISSNHCKTKASIDLNTKSYCDLLSFLNSAFFVGKNEMGDK